MSITATDTRLGIEIEISGRGPIGHTGPQGETGATPNLTIGTVQKGADADASITGTAENPVLNLTLPKGDKGDQGAQGQTGPAATVDVGTVTTGAAGSQASVENVGDEHAAVFNFTIPKGDKGDKGDPGNATIDDTKGAGATTYVWSADKSWSTANNLQIQENEIKSFGLNIEQGYYAIADGSKADSANWCRANISAIDCLLDAPSPISMMLLAYNRSGEYAGTWNGTQFITGSGLVSSMYLHNIDIGQFAKQYPNYVFRVDFYKNGQALTPQQVDSSVTISKLLTPYPVSVSVLSADKLVCFPIKTGEHFTISSIDGTQFQSTARLNLYDIDGNYLSYYGLSSYASRDIASSSLDFWYITLTGTTLTAKVKRIGDGTEHAETLDATMNAIGQNLGNIKGLLDDTTEVDCFEKTIGLKPVRGILEDGSIPNPWNTNAVNTTNYIDVGLNDFVDIIVTLPLSAGEEYQFGYSTYNSSKTLVDNITTPKAEYKTIHITNSAIKYIRFSIFKHDGNDYVPLRIANFGTDYYVFVVRHIVGSILSDIDCLYEKADISNSLVWEICGVGSAGERYTQRNYSISAFYIKGVSQLIIADDYVVWIALYDGSQSFITRITGLSSTVDVNYYCKSYNAEYVSIELQYCPGGVTDTTPQTNTNRKSNISIIQIKLNNEDEIERIKDDADKYNDLLSQARYAYSSGDSGVATNPRQLTLLHFSDVHNSLSGMKFALQMYNKYSSKIDNILHTGDVVTANFSDGITNWINSGCAEVVLNVIGNHDTEEGLVLQAAGKENVYNAFFAPYISDWDVVQPTGVDDSSSDDYCALYYYKDFDTPKIRLIVLDTNFWDAAESTWLTSVLADAKTNEYAVLIACHDVKHLEEMTNSNFSAYPGDGINEATNAYANQPNDWLDPVDDFIDDGGEFICILAGHNHSGHMGYITNYPNIFCYVSDKASSSRVPGAARKIGEINENTVNIVTVNVDEHLFKIVKIGAEVDGKMRGRHVFCYDYANKQIISQW